MSDTYSIETRYSVKFTTENPVPISKIVESLVAYEKLLRRTPRFIERAYPGIQIIETQVLVDHIESGSLIEDFVIRYVFKSDENYDNFKESVAKIMDDNGALKTLVAIGMGAIIGYGIFTYVGHNPAKTHVEAYNNTIINIGS
ncbi:MAG: hypothetical protein H6989_04690, partial [Pseudomonadales bacterium]|nr:hypothetical protein [Pseudomonadales bacterium]